MDTTRKPHAGEAGAAAASKAESPIERTVLGVAPPAAPAPVSPAPPAGGAPPEAVTRAAPAGAAPIATAPLIPIAESGPQPAPAPAAPTSPASRGPAGDSTLPVLPGAGAAPASRREPPASALESLERTATTAEYLQAARATALNELAGAGQVPAPAATLPAAPPPREPAGVGGPQSRPLVAPPPSLLQADLPPPISRGFEPVPPVRAPLAESLSGAWGPVADIGGSRPPPTLSPAVPGPPRSRHEAAGRWLLLAAVALVSVAVVWFGGRLLSRHRSTSARTHALAATDVTRSGERRPEALPASTASRALLANLPAAGNAEGASGGTSRVTVVSATGGRREGSGPQGAGAAASSESQLAATAGRHVLSGNFAEALPVYQELERAWPDNTAYAAMAKLLRARVGASSERPMVAPASPKATKGAR